MRYLLFLLLDITILVIYSDASEEKPKLIPMANELIIEEGSEIRIDCYSDQAPLHFSFPEYTFMSPRSPHEILPSTNGTWTFLRRNAVFLDTGWYACAAEGVEIENHFSVLNHTHENIAWIYVYVSSFEPFADRYYTFPKTIIALSGSPVIVPCRPTSPDLDVELWRDFRIVESNEQVWFDPTIGFIVKPPTSGNLQTLFQCKVNGTEDRYILRYLNATGQRPRINPIDDELFLREGDELRIECYSESNVQFTFPGKYDVSNNMKKTSGYDFFSDKKGKTTFLRRAVFPEDTGWYGCAEEGFDLDISPLYINYTRKVINWIYVYVESNTTKLLLARNTADYNFIPDNSVLVPCRPTSSKFDVRLKSSSEILEKNVRFYPKLGFIMRRGLSRFEHDCYSCVIDVEHITTWSLEDYVYSVLPAVPTELIIRERWCIVLFMAENFRFDCYAYPINEIYLAWNTPAGKSKSQRHLCCPDGIFNANATCKMEYREKQLIAIDSERDSDQWNCAARSATVAEDTPIDIYIYGISSHADVRSYTFTVLYGESFELGIDMESSTRPIQNFTWLTPSGALYEYEMLLGGDKYNIIPYESSAILGIRNINFNDAGLYRLSKSSGSFREINLILNVQGLPAVTMEDGSEPYYTAPGKTFLVSSTIIALPRPNITWGFTRYPNFPSNKEFLHITPLNHQNTLIDQYRQFSILRMSTNTSGRLACTACNYFECITSFKLIVVSDDIGRFSMIVPNEKVYLGDDVALTCAGSNHAFQNLSWNEQSDECDKNVNRKTFYIEESRTQYTIRSVLRIRNVTKCHQKSYSCWGETKDTNIEHFPYYLNLSVAKKPKILRSNLGKEKIYFDSDDNDHVQKSLFCCVDGDPIPNVIWFKDKLKLQESSANNNSADACAIFDVDLQTKESGRYTCRAQNRFGQAEHYIDFEFTVGMAIYMKLLISAVVLILIFVIIAGLVIRKRRRKILRRRLQEDILKRFETGALDRFNPDVDIADQAEVLPYDEDWEYPRNLLKLGKILGRGAFGIVRKAEAKSIRPGEPVTTVAVKTVHATSTLHHMLALSRELKVLVHLGENLNIVNLLGACTKNISYGELFVIVEFCRFGNLQDYLSRQRANFIDEVDPVTGEINTPDLGTPGVNVIDNCDGNSVTGGSFRSRDSTNTNLVDENEASSAAVLDSGVRSKYGGDYVVSSLEPIRTKDLLCWAWQVSRGMRYLGDRKVVHGDLAARNILLADNNVIKICDFGLAKALFKVDHYKVTGGDPLPLKWMPVEAIADLRFSIESDVWSFGIVLWELFSLAESPYPGIHPRQVYQTLLDGYRMDKPKYAPKIIYRQMMKCWEAEPANRPSFASLEIAIHELLEDSVLTYYADMSNQYNDMRAGILRNGKKDYLTMDPSEIGAVSFSAEQEEVKLSDIASHKAPTTSSPDPS